MENLQARGVSSAQRMFSVTPLACSWLTLIMCVPVSRHAAAWATLQTSVRFVLTPWSRRRRLAATIPFSLAGICGRRHRLNPCAVATLTHRHNDAVGFDVVFVYE